MTCSRAFGGWAEGFLAENYSCIGFDIERHDYGTGGYPGHLILQDVRTIYGAQFKLIADRIACIVASPPCTEYSYMAMPWKRAKQIASALRGQDSFPSDYKGSRTIEQLNELFNACFRIQRELSEVASRHIPMIVENVKGAQPWVGMAQANFGSFFLWGDIGRIGNRVVPLNGRLGSDVGVRATKAKKVEGFRFDGSGKSFQTAAVKSTGQDWSRFKKTVEVSPHWIIEAVKVPSESGRSPSPGNGVRFTSRDCGIESTKLGGDWFHEYAKGQGPRNHASGSKARARASAEIAKIPFPLSCHIAKVFYPHS